MAQQMSAPAKAQGTLILTALKLSRNEQNPWESYTTVSELYFVGGAGARVHTGVKSGFVLYLKLSIHSLRCNYGLATLSYYLLGS